MKGLSLTRKKMVPETYITKKNEVVYRSLHGLRDGLWCSGGLRPGMSSEGSGTAQFY